MQEFIFRFPHSQEIYQLKPSALESPICLHSFNDKTELSLEGTFVEISEKQLLDLNLTTDSAKNKFSEKTPQKEEYLTQIETAIEKVKQQKLPKIVLSRRKWISANEKKIDLGKTFLKLCEDYPNTFVYLYFSEKEIWLGATPELLGKYEKEKEEFHTMSLAGTLLKEENWSSKEKEEQEIVTQYIKSVLEKFSSDLNISPTYDHISGKIKHLRNDFKANFPLNRLEEVVQILHPTPAVCGIPKEICKNLLQEIENYNRKYYAGYIRVETQKEIYYFVNLRCAEIFSNGTLLYVGGGITAHSNPQKEWQETELKSEAVGTRLNYF